MFGVPIKTHLRVFYRGYRGKYVIDKRICVSILYAVSGELCKEGSAQINKKQPHFESAACFLERKML